MRAFWAGSGLLITITATLAGCAAPSINLAFDNVRQAVSDRIDQDVRWDRGSPDDAPADDAVRDLLAHPLEAAHAVQIALLRNAGLQAKFEDLAISQADLVQAGLLRNPVFAASARYPSKKQLRSNIQLSVVTDFLDVLVRPARVRIAEAQLEETTLRVSHAVVMLAGDVEAAYYEALGAHHVTGILARIAEAAAASAELARRLHHAGNFSDRQWTLEQGQLEEARVSLARARMDEHAAIETVTALMGLHGAQTAWKLPDALPAIPDDDGELGSLESLAIANRFDLAAARQEVALLRGTVELIRSTRYVGGLDVGVNGERDTDGVWVTGPNTSIELPVFDQRQAAIASLEARVRRADDRLLELAVQIRSDVRRHRDRLMLARDLVMHFRDVVVPLREDAVKYTQEEFNYMLVGAFELIEAKKAEYEAYRSYLDGVRDYWISRAALKQAVGGQLEDATAEEHSIGSVPHGEQ